MYLWTREEYHKKKWKHIYSKNNCPFCTNIKENEWYIVWKWKYWFIIHNRYPYSWDNQHLMAVPYTHKKYYLGIIRK